MPLNKDFTFDGVNKIMQGIYETDGSSPDFPPGFHELDIQRDVYSEWKVWVREGDNAKYLQALSTTGGDPISSTISVGAYFFLENDWKIRPVEDDHRVVFNGNLYTRDDSTAYLGVDDYSIVTETRNSSLTQTVSTGGAGGGSTAAEIWAHSNRTLTAGGVTAIQSGLATSAGVSAIPTNPLLTNDARLDNIDATISSRLATAGYTAPANADITAIKAKTDTLVNTDLTGIATSAEITALNDVSPAEVKAQADQALIDYDGPTKAELDATEANITKDTGLIPGAL